MMPETVSKISASPQNIASTSPPSPNASPLCKRKQERFVRVSFHAQPAGLASKTNFAVFAAGRLASVNGHGRLVALERDRDAVHRSPPLPGTQS